MVGRRARARARAPLRRSGPGGTSSTRGHRPGRRRGRGRLRSGMITSVRPAACAASTLCFSPPIGRTRPCKVTSPVIPTVCLTARFVSSEARAVVIVIPALGPSFGIAPAGTCTWNDLRFQNRPPTMSKGLPVRANPGEGDLRRLLHHVAQLAGEHEAALAVHAGRLDEEDVAARASDGKPGGHARHGVRSAASCQKRWRSEPVAQLWSRSIAIGASASPDAIRVAVLRSSFPSRAQLPDARLARVLADDRRDQLVRDLRPRPRAVRSALRCRGQR